MDIEYILSIFNKKLENIDNYIDKIVTDILFIKVSDKSTQTECICCKFCCPKKQTDNKYTIDEQVHLMKNRNETFTEQPTPINKKQKIVKFIDNINNNNSNEIAVNSTDKECVDIVIIKNKKEHDDYECNDNNDYECNDNNDYVGNNDYECNDNNNYVGNNDYECNDNNDYVGNDYECNDNNDYIGNDYEGNDNEGNNNESDIQKNEEYSLIDSSSNNKTSLMDTVLIDSESDSDSSFGNEYEILDIDEIANEKKEN